MDAINYKNGQKNNWRNHAWNWIRDMCGDRRNAIVLYLPGSTDLDREVATRKGFSDQNMIAVERSPSVCRHLRDQKRTVINASLSEAMESFGDAHRVGVVVADLQCGVTDEVAHILDVYINHPAFDECVLLLNVQRGRDPSELLKWTKNSAARGEELFPRETLCDRDELEWRRFKSRKSVESVLRTSMIMQLVLESAESSEDLWYEDCLAVREALDAIDKEMKIAKDLRSLAMQESARQKAIALGPRIDAYSNRLRFIPLIPYKSSARSPFFDGVVIRYKSAAPRSPWTGERPVKGDVSAALAVRTMRINGRLRRAS